jgi:hypothetical protein
MLVFLWALYLLVQWLCFNIARIRRAVSSVIASSRYYERSVDSVHVHGSLTNSLSIVREESYSHKTDISNANQRQDSWKIIHSSEASCNNLQYDVQSSLTITGEVNTTADTLLDAKEKIFVRVITAQAPNKIAGFFRLSCHGMLSTPLAFDCSANEMSSALLELPSFERAAGLASRVHISGIWQFYRMCPWRVLYLH